MPVKKYYVVVEENEKDCEGRWRWNQIVKRPIERKKAMYKNLENDRLFRNKREYLKALKDAKSEVAKVKAEKYQEMYDELRTNEGERKIYKLARGWSKKTKDIEVLKVVKAQNAAILYEKKKGLGRWRDYYEELMNDNEKEIEEKRVKFVVNCEVTENEIALRKMGKGRALGLGNITNRSVGVSREREGKLVKGIV